MIQFIWAAAELFPESAPDSRLYMPPPRIGDAGTWFTLNEMTVPILFFLVGCGLISPELEAFFDFGRS